MTKSRNAMTLGTAEEWTFLAMNYPRLFLAPRPKVKVAPRGEDLTLEQHAGLRSRGSPNARPRWF